MSARRLTDTHILVVAGLLTAVLAGAAAFIAPAGGSGGYSPSSFNAAPGGGKAAFLTLARLGYDIERSYEPMTALQGDPARTTLLLTGPISASEQDRRALQKFLERGGTALLIGRQGADFLRLTGTSPADPVTRPTRHRVLAPSPLSRGAQDITMVPASSPPRLGPSWVRLFTVHGDQPIVATARTGNGRAVWWAAPTPLTNAAISDADNLQLLLNLAGRPGEKRILWDEHYHGHTRSLWSYAARTPLPWVGAQLGLMTIALFAGYSRRRGPVRSKRTAPRTSALEFIDVLRTLYKRAGASAPAVAAARKRLQRVTASMAGIPIDSPDELLAKAIAAKTGLPLRDVLDVLESTRDTATTDAPAALKRTQQLQRLTASVLAHTRQMPR